MVVLGASGAGKSSFLRAGLYPRLQRDDRHFLPLPVIRPERGALYGETGFLAALAGAFEEANIAIPRAQLRAAIQGGSANLKSVLKMLLEKAASAVPDRDANLSPPTIVLPIDQAEELFTSQAYGEAHTLLALLRDLLTSDSPALMGILTRSDNYDRVQEAWELGGIEKVPFDLGPMPRGAYAEVIKGPAQRLDGTSRAFKIDDGLVDGLLADIEAGGAKDALPLLAFTLERLHDEYHRSGSLTFDHYNRLGRVKGSIEAAIERAFTAADADPKIPRDRQARLALLRCGLIPMQALIPIPAWAHWFIASIDVGLISSTDPD